MYVYVYTEFSDTQAVAHFSTRDYMPLKGDEINLPNGDTVVVEKREKTIAIFYI